MKEVLMMSDLVSITHDFKAGRIEVEYKNEYVGSVIYEPYFDYWVVVQVCRPVYGEYYTLLRNATIEIIESLNKVPIVIEEAIPPDDVAISLIIAGYGKICNNLLGDSIWEYKNVDKFSFSDMDRFKERRGLLLRGYYFL